MCMKTPKVPKSPAPPPAPPSDEKPQTVAFNENYDSGVNAKRKGRMDLLIPLASGLNIPR